MPEVLKSCFLSDSFLKLRLMLFGVACVVLSMAAVFAQESTIIIHGTVLDPSGKAVEGASVQLEHEGSSSIKTATDSKGVFIFRAVPGGTYRISAERSGLHSRVASVPVVPDGNRNIDLVLEPVGDTAAMQFADQPNFTVAGITDWTAAGGHGSDITLRTSEALTRETATLKPETAGRSTSSSEAAGAGQHRLLGDRDEARGDSLAAEHEYEQAARLDPSEQNYFAWGAELLLHRAVQPAVEVFARGVSAYPKSARMLAASGAALFAAGHDDEAALRICKASDLDPSDVTPYVFLGKIEMAAPMPLNCVEEKLARFAQQQPDNALANYYYAMAIWKRQKELENPQTLQQVEALLERAAKIDSKFADAYLQLGIFSYTQSDFAKSVELYRKALEADPQLCDAHYRLGLAYQRTGEPAKAKAEFQLHDEMERQQAADVERQRRGVKQFMVVLKDQPAATSPQ